MDDPEHSRHPHLSEDEKNMHMRSLASTRSHYAEGRHINTGEVLNYVNVLRNNGASADPQIRSLLEEISDEPNFHAELRNLLQQLQADDRGDEVLRAIMAARTMGIGRMITTTRGRVRQHAHLADYLDDLERQCQPISPDAAPDADRTHTPDAGANEADRNPPPPTTPPPPRRPGWSNRLVSWLTGNPLPNPNQGANGQQHRDRGMTRRQFVGVSLATAAATGLAALYGGNYRGLRRTIDRAVGPLADQLVTRGSEILADPEGGLFGQFMAPFVEEAHRRREQRESQETTLYWSINREINTRNRINFLVQEFGPKKAGDVYILSYNSDNGSFDFIFRLNATSYARNIEHKLPTKERKPMSLASAWGLKDKSGKALGGFDLIRESVEDATGLFVDFQMIFQEEILDEAITKLAGSSLEPFLSKESSTKTPRSGKLNALLQKLQMILQKDPTAFNPTVNFLFQKIDQKKIAVDFSTEDSTVLPQALERIQKAAQEEIREPRTWVPIAPSVIPQLNLGSIRDLNKSDMPQDNEILTGNYRVLARDDWHSTREQVRRFILGRRTLPNREEE